LLYLLHPCSRAHAVPGWGLRLSRQPRGLPPRPPTGDELNHLLDSLSRRIVRVPERRGLLIADPEYPSLDWVPDASLDHLQAASVAYRIAIGPQAERKTLTLYIVPPLEEAPHNPLLARLAGFSLHAAPMSWMQRLKRLFAMPQGTRS